MSMTAAALERSARGFSPAAENAPHPPIDWMRHILIVDDDALLAESLRRILQKEGFRVTTANCGERGLDAIRESTPDLMMTDVSMPEMDGFRLLYEARRLVPGLPIILMSGRSSVEAAVRALKIGAADFLEKPLSRSEALSAIRRVIARTASA